MIIMALKIIGVVVLFILLGIAFYKQVKDPKDCGCEACKKMKEMQTIGYWQDNKANKHKK